MDILLLQFVDRVLEIASGRGLSETDPIIVKIENPNDFSETFVIASYFEPHEYILPLNVTWIDANPGSLNYLKAFKRGSKTPSLGFNHTWNELTTYNAIFEPPQFWSPEDNPIPVFSEDQPNQGGGGSGASQADLDAKVNRAGDTMEGPLRARTLADDQVPADNWDNDEFIPRDYLSTEMNRQTQGFNAILTFLNNRLNALSLIVYENRDRHNAHDLIDHSAVGGGITSEQFALLQDAVQQNTDALALLGNVDVGDSGNDQQRIEALEQAIQDLGVVDVGDSGTDDSRITALEDAIANLTPGGGGNVAKYVHTQDTAASSWVINHNFANEDLIYEIKDDTGRAVLPQEQYILEGSGNNISVVTFALPITGQVLVIAA